MSFVQPWFLLGTLLGAVPILIHMINRRNARPLSFSALDFLLRSDRRLARRLKIKELLLLALRTLLVIALPIALARPYAPAQETGFVATGSPRSVVVVLDCGLHQRALDDHAGGGAILMERVRKKAQELFKGLPAGSTAGVVLAKSVPSPLFPHLSSNLDELVQGLDGIAPSFASADLVGAVEAASILLKEEGLGLAEIAVVGRLTEEEVRGLNDLELGSQGLSLHPVRRETPIKNLRILSVRSDLSDDGVPGLRVQVENEQKEPRKTTVTLEMGGQVVRREIEIPAGKFKELRFAWSDQGSASEVLPETAKVSLDGDDFPPDDHWFLVREGEPRTGVLVINGATSAIPFQDEVFFLSRALQALAKVGIQLGVEVVTPDTLRPASISGRQVVVLANVHLIPLETIHTIRTAVEGGMGLLVSAGDNLDPEFGSRMRELLPLPFRGVQGGGTRLGEEQGLAIATINPHAGAAGQLVGKGGESLKKGRVFRYAIFSPPNPEDEDVSTWVSLENGAPLLLERRLGLGSLMFLATSLDLDWTDLPAHPGYVQLLGILLQHLAGHGAFSAPTSVAPGETWTLALPDQEAPQDVRLLGPGSEAGADVEVRATDSGMKVVVNQVEIPGVYELWLEVAKERESARRFSVNIIRDSTGSPLASEELLAAALSVPELSESARIPDEALEFDEPVPGTPLWPIVLLALVLLLATETYAALKV